MFHRLQRSSFVRPRERLYELLTLQQADNPDGMTLEAAPESLLDTRTIGGYVADLESRSLLVRDGTDPAQPTRFRLTEDGRQRLRLLVVDLARELAGLHAAATELLRRRLVPLAVEGVRRVAFYPFGETAEAAYAAIQDLGFELVAIVDDSPSKQGLRFHGLEVGPSANLRHVAPEVVLVTTSVFQERITARLREMGLAGVRIQLL